MIMCSLATCFCFMDMVLKERLFRFFRASRSSATVSNQRLDGMSDSNPAANNISNRRNLDNTKQPPSFEAFEIQGEQANLLAFRLCKRKTLLGAKPKPHLKFAP